MEDMEDNTKKYITSLLTSTPLAVTVQQLAKDYRNTIGEGIPYHKLGYNSLEHFLRSIPDTVHINGTGPSAEVILVIQQKSAHINNLVTSQKVSLPKKKHKSFGSNRNLSYGSNIGQRPFIKPSLRKNLMQYQQPPRFQPQAQRKIHYPISTDFLSTSDSNNSTASHIQSNINTYNKLEEISERVNNLKIDNMTMSANQAGESTFNSDKEISEPINNKLNIYNIDRSANYTAQNSVIDRYNPSVKQTASAVLPNRSTVTHHHSKERIRPPSKHLENNVPFNIRNNLRVMIGQYPEGIWCAKVPQIYRRMFNSELKYEDLGFRSLIDLCTCLSSVFHYVRPSKDDFKLYDRSRPLPDCAETKYTIASSSYSLDNINKSSIDSENGSALPNVDWEDVRGFLPEGTFKPGQPIPREFVPLHSKDNDNIDVVVGEIYDISKFWVYQANGLLDQLMDDIQHFYQNHFKDYQIPQNLIREGLYCVQVVYGEYHRAVVVDVMPEVEDMIRVLFIDYGTMTKTSIKGLCFLHNTFAELPAQAIRCRLANIQPPQEGTPWSRESSKAFRRMIMKRDLTAKICRVNWEDQYLEVCLADVTDTKNIFYVNNRLVEEGYARYLDQVQDKSLIDSVCTPIVKFIHLFPTFAELEHGMAPSTLEMEVFFDCNVPVNFCYPQYFFTDTSSEEINIKLTEQFHETHCIKGRRDVHNHFFDVSKFAERPLNMSLFGELEPEITLFLNESENSSEDISNMQEKLNGNNETENEIAAISKRLNFLQSKTICELRKDCLLAEDIMNDLSIVCDTSSLNLEPDFENMNHNESAFWPINETEDKSANSSAILNDWDEYSEEKKFVENFENEIDDADSLDDHPLSKMSFDRIKYRSESSSSLSPTSDSSANYLQDDDTENPNFRLQEYVSRKELISGGASEEEEVARGLNDLGVVHNKNTNPFLIATDDTIDKDNQMELNNFKRNKTNPFLEENVEDVPSDDSEGSSGSTVYETYTEEVNMKQSWSPQENKMSDVMSMVESVSITSISDSAHVSQTLHKYDISPQDSEHIARPSMPAQNYHYGSFTIPINTYVWPMNFNPQFPDNHIFQNYGSVYPYGQKFGPFPYSRNQYEMGARELPPQPTITYLQPPSQNRVICPPPGFAPNSNYYQRNEISISQPAEVSSINAVPPGFLLNNNQSRNRMEFIRNSLISNLNISNEKDFYDVYNERLRTQIQGGNT